ncbi:unnamed protein product, partial [Laminaria digitata]
WDAPHPAAATATPMPRAISRYPRWGDEEENRNLLSTQPQPRSGDSWSEQHRPIRRTGLLWTATARASSPSSSSSPAGDDHPPPATATAVATKRGPAASFFRDLSMLFRVFFVRGLFVGRRWLFPLVLACTASGYEIAASTILNVIGDFYL